MPETVLVVDDDPAVGRVLTGLLAQAGWRSRWASSGAQALAELKSMPTDLVITDLRMDGMDGMELLTHARAGFPEIPVIVLSADATPEQRERLLAGGANGYLTKPIDVTELLTLVDQILAAGAKGLL